VDAFKETDTTYPQASFFDFVVVDKSRNSTHRPAGNIDRYPSLCIAVTKVEVDGGIKDTLDLALHGWDPVGIVVIDEVRNINEISFQGCAGNFDHLNQRTAFLSGCFEHNITHREQNQN